MDCDRNCTLIGQFHKGFVFSSTVLVDVISEPVMLDQFVAVADYKKQNKNEVNMIAGDVVEVIDKNENGNRDSCINCENESSMQIPFKNICFFTYVLLFDF